MDIGPTRAANHAERRLGVQSEQVVLGHNCNLRSYRAFECRALEVPVAIGQRSADKRAQSVPYRAARVLAEVAPNAGSAAPLTQRMFATADSPPPTVLGSKQLCKPGLLDDSVEQPVDEPFEPLALRPR